MGKKFKDHLGGVWFAIFYLYFQLKQKIRAKICLLGLFWKCFQKIFRKMFENLKISYPRFHLFIFDCWKYFLKKRGGIVVNKWNSVLSSSTSRVRFFRRMLFLSSNALLYESVIYYLWQTMIPASWQRSWSPADYGRPALRVRISFTPLPLFLSII